jgi:hypothetical protein
LTKKKIKKNKKIFTKGIDKTIKICYNNYRKEREVIAMKKIVIIKDSNNNRFYGEFEENEKSRIDAGNEILLRCRIRQIPCRSPVKIIGSFEKLPATEIEVLREEMAFPLAPWRMEELKLALKYL